MEYFTSIKFQKLNNPKMPEKRDWGFAAFQCGRKDSRKNEYNDISDLSPGKDYIKELECFDNKTIYMQFSEWDVNRS